MKSLTEPSELESEDLLKIIGDGRATMILLQSALGTLQRKMGETAGEKPGAEFLAAIRSAEKIRVPIELIDRDVNARKVDKPKKVETAKKDKQTLPKTATK